MPLHLCTAPPPPTSSGPFGQTAWERAVAIVTAYSSHWLGRGRGAKASRLDPFWKQACTESFGLAGHCSADTCLPYWLYLGPHHGCMKWCRAIPSQTEECPRSVPGFTPNGGGGLVMGAVGCAAVAATALVFGGGGCSVHLEEGQRGGVRGLGVEHPWQLYWEWCLRVHIFSCGPQS